MIRHTLMRSTLLCLIAAVATADSVVPDRFLRRWDPITVFFDRDRGPRTGAAEHDPQRLIEIDPPHPGAYTWIDARTLQFRPADPWPALERFRITVRGHEHALGTLMAAPRSTLPRSGADGLEPVDTITLVFPEPLDADALRRMTTIDLRPLPGLDRSASSTRTGDDFTIKEQPRTGDDATYVLVLRRPIPLGTRALVHLRLALDDDPERAFHTFSFATAREFRVTAVGCRDGRLPVAPDGTRHGREQAIRCEANDPTVVLELTARPRALGPVEARNLVRFTPAVDSLRTTVAGKRLELRGAFRRDQLYRVRIEPTAIDDEHGRPLVMRGRSEVHLFFPGRAPYLLWQTGGGILERHGPRMIPLEGRGTDRIDLRIHPIDPLDRSFWPFPTRPVLVDEAERPPGPGEEPAPHRSAGRDVSAAELQRHLRTLGSPVVSTLVDLPLTRGGAAARFGLDLTPHLATIAGERAAGHYLVGLRRLDSSDQRAWLRVQVTDLVLTTLEESNRVRLAVTSLRDGRPVKGAMVRVEGNRGARWTTLYSGTTTSDGTITWRPDEAGQRGATVRRIVVSKADDVLVLHPLRAPDGFHDGHFRPSGERWLQWTQSSLAGRGTRPETRAHVFTERPVYRPSEPVHVQGWARRRDRGRLEPLAFEGHLVIAGPSGLEWRYPIELSESGGFYHRFHEENRPSGPYHATLEGPDGGAVATVDFLLDAYRIPRFEVRLSGPDEVPLDRRFPIDLAALYYAGGQVAARPVAWRVTQFPYAWRPPARDGFVFSTDRRFSGATRFEATPRLDRQDLTDAAGGAHLELDPAIEPTAQPRRYVIEATVTGLDDQTVTATKSVLALPPFVLGVKTERFLERATHVAAEVLAIGTDGEPIAGQALSVRLLHRQWHSHLTASDFSDGVARWVTDIVDEPIAQRELLSTTEPIVVEIPIDAAGVYLVEVSARDRLGRAQVVTVDLYAGGGDPIAWEKPPTPVFEVSTDRASYRPGETAALVLKSPFQRAEVLAVVERPDGNRYDWLSVRAGQATYRVAVTGTHAPRLPVHFVLFRGRVRDTGPRAGSGTDLGKPSTMAATTWLSVEPVANRVEVELQAPATARPGETVTVTVRLRRPSGEPIEGEVALWLVDEAVLALGKEKRLDPLPDFLSRVSSHLTVRDTRNLAFGELPFRALPGGGEGASEPPDLFDRTTVRERFESVPYYEPFLEVGPSGELTVEIELPDDLTTFALRAKVASGPDRFGFATGRLAVRLPLIVQPALPRFVRPGDRFELAAIGRIVEGHGGPGTAVLRVEGLEPTDATERAIDWDPTRPQRIVFPVTVPSPEVSPDGAPPYDHVIVAVAVERADDGASDAFRVELPVRPDRRPVRRRLLADLAPGVSIELPAVDGTPRAGSVRRSVLIATEPALVRMAAGLDFLHAYPYGCTEQRLSRARARIAFRRLRDRLGRAGDETSLEATARQMNEWIEAAVDARGLVAYWPGGKGYVALTAWTAMYLDEARDADLPIDEDLRDRLLDSLERALRSDYAHFVDGASWAERAWSLAALASNGRYDAGYGAELARRSRHLDQEGAALVLEAMAAAGEGSSRSARQLAAELWDGLAFRLHQGRETYAGLQARHGSTSSLILPGEARALARTTRALARIDGQAERFPLLVQALVTLGRGDGWGTTNANAEAILALSSVLDQPSATGPVTVRVAFGDDDRTLRAGDDSTVARLASSDARAARAALVDGDAAFLLAATSYVPRALGREAGPIADGFVVSRAALVVSTEDAPLARQEVTPGATITLEVGAVVEDHVQVVNPQERHFVAVVAPLAAGVEPLNPALATAPPEARPTRALTLEPTYVQYGDDAVAFYYDTLPAGTFDFHFRVRATIEGSFTQPPAEAELMYDETVWGGSAGSAVVITRAPEESE